VFFHEELKGGHGRIKLEQQWPRPTLLLPRYFCQAALRRHLKLRCRPNLVALSKKQ